MNCGFATRISGETDFPCIYGERVGLGRSYVKLDSKHPHFDDWCEGIRKGRAYVSDGRSHLLEFKVNDVPLGEHGSTLNLTEPGSVKATLQASAFLSPEPNPSIRDRPYDQKPYWHIERARVGDSRDVEVEILVNGNPVKTTRIPADGEIHDITAELPIKHSSWVAARILPSSHTNPIWVTVGKQPVRASKRSAEWCLQGVKTCWKQKEKFIAPGELEDARQAYAHAEATYKKIIEQSLAD